MVRKKIKFMDEDFLLIPLRYSFTEFNVFIKACSLYGRYLYLSERVNECPERSHELQTGGSVPHQGDSAHSKHSTVSAVR